DIFWTTVQKDRRCAQERARRIDGLRRVLARHEHAPGREHGQTRGIAVDGHGDAGTRRAVHSPRLYVGLPRQAAGRLAAGRIRPEDWRGVRAMDRYLALGLDRHELPRSIAG